MFAKIFSCAVLGLEGHVIEVEVDSGRGMPGLTVVGLPDTAVRESGERVRAAIRNSGLKFPGTRVTVNLAPASLKKAGPAYDLAIALGVLIASEQSHDGALAEAMALGELALDGNVRHVRGVLPATAFARQRGFKRIFVPACDAAEAALVPGIEVIAVSTLAHAVDMINGSAVMQGCTAEVVASTVNPLLCVPLIDFKDIKGQEVAKRALELAAVGGHNLLMTGSPGAGKTMLARALPGILPPLSPDESLDVTRLYSIADMLPGETPLLSTRPFRAPHHTISHAGMVGGGKFPRPGEVSLAHRGVLFLDELPEFDARTLEVLRQPLEDKTVTISRASGALSFPANFMLIAAMNPCRCGWHGDPAKPCTCSAGNVLQYQKKISGPLLDRIDIHLSVTRVQFEHLNDARSADSSEAIRARVLAARAQQSQRFAGSGVHCNADMSVAELRQHCAMDEAGSRLMKSAMAQLKLSARGFHRVLKLARSIADVAGAERIGTAHLAEALQYRPRGVE